MKSSVRGAIVVIAICSWVAISNHCAFAALATKTDSVRTECPFHSKPAKQKEQSSQVQCCKVLRAVVLANTKSWTRDDTNFFDANLHPAEFRFTALVHNALAPLFLDTGPPDAQSFAESILQRSLLAHAPPSTA
jgi:hypothetical protein